MKKVLFVGLLLASTAFVPAHADLVLMGGTVASSFQDIGAQGFGNAPRILTEQTNGYEQGLVRPDSAGLLSFPQVFPNVAAPGFNNAIGNNAIDTGNFKGAISTINALGWQSGANVGIGFNSDQEGQTGITLQKLTIALFGPIGGGIDLLGTFSTPMAINFTSAQLALQQGNGNAVFEFVLDSAQQSQWDAIVAANPGNLIVGAAAILGCGVGAPAGCMETNDGPDSFRAISAVPGPIVGAGIPGLVAACGALWAMARRRRQQQQFSAA